MRPSIKPFVWAFALMLGLGLSAGAVQAKTSGTHQNKVRKDVVYVVEGDIREARISFIDSNGNVEQDIVRVPWKLKVSVPCKRKVSIAARNMSPSGHFVARIEMGDKVIKEVSGDGHLTGIFTETLTCP